jgi:hypothetical protein
MERSESGAPIYRYEKSERGFEFAVGDSENIDRITAHAEKHIGPVSTVLHEVISDLIHIDVHVIEPSEQRNCYTLITSGMSDRPMQAPEEYSGFRFSELLICLPPHWPMTQESWKVEENYWPIRMLKFLARFPHEYQTWLWLMHTIPNGDPAEPFAANTAMSGAILLPPVTFPSDFSELKIDENKTIHFHAVVPLFPDEMDLKLRKGAEALFDGFDENGVSEILNLGRSSVVKKKRSWFPFRR